MREHPVLQQRRANAHCPASLYREFKLFELLQHAWQRLHSQFHQLYRRWRGRRTHVRPIHPGIEARHVQGPPRGEHAAMVDAHGPVGFRAGQQQVSRVAVRVENPEVETRHSLRLVQSDHTPSVLQIPRHAEIFHWPMGAFDELLYRADLSPAALLDAGPRSHRHVSLAPRNSVDHVGGLLTQRAHARLDAPPIENLLVERLENRPEGGLRVRAVACHQLRALHYVHANLRASVGLYLTSVEALHSRGAAACQVPKQVGALCVRAAIRRWQARS
mmetsp:Transcript_103324/g.291732  ORF Transcript_103324/g.291732 Transcript_103324/m.291732 type:complete len:274 (-) Transcript_103324:440-1261(-)